MTGLVRTELMASKWQENIRRRVLVLVCGKIIIVINECQSLPEEYLQHPVICWICGWVSMKGRTTYWKRVASYSLIHLYSQDPPCYTRAWHDSGWNFFGDSFVQETVDDARNQVLDKEVQKTVDKMVFFRSPIL